MREYSVVKPHFWIGKTGKELRGKPEAQLLAMYLMTSPHSTMIGVFHCPIMYMAYETGLSIEGASKGLASLLEGGFCTFDAATDTVFVKNMLKFQVGENLSPKDNRVKAIKRAFGELPESKAKQEFAEFYWEVLGLEKPAQKETPLEAPCKPLRSQDQDQDQDQEQAAQIAKSAISLPLLGGASFDVKPEQIERFKDLYPNLDNEQELRNMIGWFEANPDKLRPKTKILQFVNTWLANRQTDYLNSNRALDDLDDTTWAEGLVLPSMEQAQ
ncbi:hypothetical protein K5M76_09465 [Shewanella xiamenensis]|uniref:hypothetical protein n=1 Tax=Shewanella xiamenensis TaxID=332186 RepID=UPI00217D3B71|nr:hypothetical protein [Shewanella xiamenensis]MCT8857564.1 hypothetical protein [Shewanella xiamenensis]UWG66417.1 hypothetical protein K5M76_09465 [Shewanella xiamenensis]